MERTAARAAEPGSPGRINSLLCVPGEVKAGEIRRLPISSVAVENLISGTAQGNRTGEREKRGRPVHEAL